MSGSLSRRRFLGNSGAGFAAAMLAGGALPGGFGKAVMAQDGGTEFHAAFPYLDPGTGGHFNHFVTNGILNPPNIYGDLVFVPMAMFYWATEEWLPLLATEWAFIQAGNVEPGNPEASPVAEGGIDPNADTFQVKLREGVMWSNDQPVTSKDVVDTFWCLRIMSNTAWQYLADVQAVDDYTINFSMSRPSTVVERYVIRQSPLPSAIYGEWAQRAQDIIADGKTLDDPEGKQLLDQFNQFRPEEVIASGPYTIDTSGLTSAQMLMPKNEKSYYADMAKFSRIVNFNGEGDTISAVVLSKEIDYATHGFGVATERQMLETGIRVIRPPVYTGASLLINYATLPHWNDKRMRQALAHAIDRDRNGQIALADSGLGVQYMTGMSDNFVPVWLTEDDISSLNPYEYDPEKAASLLEELGWSRDGDIWKTPDGEDAVYELIYPAEFVAFSASGQDLAAQLTEFGIVAEPRAVTHTQQPIDVDRGNFELAVRPWGSSNSPHPHYSFTTAFFNHNTLAINNGGSGIGFPLVQETDVAGTVDLEELVIASAEGLDEDQQRAQVTTIAQVYNELLPSIPLYERYGNNPALEGVRVKEWPADDDPLLQNSPYADGIPTMLIYTGELEPVDN